MFPDLDKDLIDDVVRVKEGRYVNPLQLHAQYPEYIPTDTFLTTVFI